MKCLLKNLKVSQKLSLISAAFVLPILVLLYFLTIEQNIRIDFAQKEIYGNEYLRPLKKLLELAPAYKHFSHNGRLDLSSNIKNKIDEEIGLLKNVDAELNEILITTERFNELNSHWEEIKNNPANEELQSEFILKIRGLISYVGDVSNLILDPDLDSYYIMDATLLKLPENMSLTYNLLTFGRDIISKGSVTPEEKTELIVQTGLLKTNTDALNNGVNVAFENNPAENLRGSLSGSLQKTVAATDNMLASIHEKILSDSLINISVQEYETVVNQALLSNFALWNSAVDDLDGLLQARIDGFNESKYLTLGSIALVLIVTLTFVFYIVKNISSSISLLSDAAYKFSSGNTNIKVELNSKDELGRLAGIFNEMISKINDSIFLLKQEKQDVEKKIELAVKESGNKNLYLAQSVDTMLNGIQKFAEGDLTVQLQVKNNDEISTLFKGFNKAVNSIKELINSVTEAVFATVDLSSKINSNAGEMAEGIEKQSNQTSEVSVAISQMTTTIFDITKNVGSAVKSALITGKSAKEGGEIVKDTIEGMSRVAKVVAEASLTVEGLGKSSEQIGQIIQVIDDIADQTNLLALNAAIEAARAGEQGRGFAVVADEVKKLAERTSKATNEIADMIKRIQEDTNVAVKSILNGTSEVERGRQFASKAGQSLQEIINASAEVQEIIDKVAAASEEQSSAAQQINNNIDNINNVVNNSAESIHQIVAATDELTSHTHNLQKLISKFKIKNEYENVERWN